MTHDETRLELLKKVESGVISVEEGAKLLGILDPSSSQKSTEQSEADSSSTEEIPDGSQTSTKIKGIPVDKVPETMGCWKVAWSMILWIGILFTMLSAYWVFNAYQQHAFHWQFWVMWIPFAISIGVTILGASIMKARWMHIQVNEIDDGPVKNLTISMPLPLKFAIWVMKTFKGFMPREIQEKNFPEMLTMLDESIAKGEGLQVDVDDKDGSKVHIFIG
jgi:hypothetical protein